MASISRVVILDQDSEARQRCVSFFSGEGAVNIKEYTNGRSFWDAISSSRMSPEVIVLDWSISDISGVALFNRMRSRAPTAFTALVVTSSKLKDDEMALLKEFPGTCFLAKPYDANQLRRAVQKCRDESFWIQENNATLDQIFLDLKDGKNNVKERFFAVLKSSPNKYPLVVLATRMLRRMNHNRLAHQILVESLKSFPEEPSLLTELAKVCLAEGRLNDALRLSDKAILISPKNVERLCFNGEVALGLGNIKDAEKRFSQAVGIESNVPLPVSPRLMETLPNGEQFKEAIKDNNTPLNLASLLNMTGILSIRQGRFEEGLGYYRLALSVVNSTKETAILSFNLGLGHLRAKQFSDAEIWFNKCSNIAGHLKKRSMIYQEKLALRASASSGSGWNKFQDADLIDEFEEIRISFDNTKSTDEASAEEELL